MISPQVGQGLRQVYLESLCAGMVIWVCMLLRGIFLRERLAVKTKPFTLKQIFIIMTILALHLLEIRHQDRLSNVWEWVEFQVVGFFIAASVLPIVAFSKQRWWARITLGLLTATILIVLGVVCMETVGGITGGTKWSEALAKLLSMSTSRFTFSTQRLVLAMMGNMIFMLAWAAIYEPRAQVTYPTCDNEGAEPCADAAVMEPS